MIPHFIPGSANGRLSFFVFDEEVEAEAESTLGFLSNMVLVGNGTVGTVGLSYAGCNSKVEKIEDIQMFVYIEFEVFDRSDASNMLFK